MMNAEIGYRVQYRSFHGVAKRWIDLVECIINNKSYELARAFHDLWFTSCDVSRRVLKYKAHAICRTFKTSLLPINHEMRLCSYNYFHVYPKLIIYIFHPVWALGDQSIQ